MTDEQFTAWLKSHSARVCVLVEVLASVGGIETIRYLSSTGYVSGATDAPAHTVYVPCIVGGVTVTEVLPLDGTASLSYGDIEVANPSGLRDAWLDDVWANRQISVLVGDLSWPRANFRTVFSGLVADLGARSAERLNIVLRDKSQQINTPITEAKLGGSTANKDRLLPLCFGEVHNIIPLLVDPANLEYQVHQGAIERIIEVRDNGVPVAITASLSTGKFRLAATPVGQVTASVQGAKPGGTYANTVGALVQHIVTSHGTTPLGTSDIETSQLAAFDAAHPQPVGVYLADRANTLAVCQQLAASVGAQVSIDPFGKLRLLQISLPAVGTPTAVAPTDMLDGTLSMASRPAIQPAVKLRYCQNYTVQSNLQSGIPPEHADLYAQAWLTVTATDTATAAAYRVSEAPAETDTALLATADAQAEADRRLAIWGTRRRVMAYRGTPATMLHSLGGAQTITAPRFGLDAGVTGQIIKRETDWLSLRTNTEVLT